MESGQVIFMGTGDFAVPLLNALHSAGERIALVVTRPDRPKGRGRKLAPTPVKAAALELGLEVEQPENVNDPDYVARLTALDAEFLVLADYGQLLKAPVLGVSRRGPVNLHPSLLPRHRGPAPVAWTILSGDEKAGASVMIMDEGMDSGPLLAQLVVEMEPGVTLGELSDKLSRLGAGLLVDTLDGMRRGEVEPVEQDHALATLSSLIDRDTMNVDWTEPAERVAGLVNALSPRPGARAYLNSKLVKLLRALPDRGQGQAGEVLQTGQNGIVVACGTGAVLLVTVQPEGKKPMDAAAFARGGGIYKGEIFGKPT